jgi:hypothetical protein
MRHICGMDKMHLRPAHGMVNNKCVFYSRQTSRCLLTCIGGMLPNALCCGVMDAAAHIACSG